MFHALQCRAEHRRAHRAGTGGGRDHDTGLIASHFETDFYPVQAAGVALVHAAAGGLDLPLTQFIKLRGKIIGRAPDTHKKGDCKGGGFRSHLCRYRRAFCGSGARADER